MKTILLGFIIGLSFLATNLWAAEAPGAPMAVSKPEAIAVYEQAWQTADNDARLKLIGRFWSEESRYVDPATKVQGVAALNKMIGDFIKMFPDAVLESDGFLAMDNSYTWNWRIFLTDKNTADKNLMLAGRDYARLDANGRIAELVGFWEKPGLEHRHQKVVATYFESLFKTRDMKKIASLLNADSVFHQAAGLPYGGDFVGFENWLKMYQQAGSLYDLKIEKEPVWFAGADHNHVALYFVIRCTSKKSGKILSMPISEHFELKDGKILSIRPFYFDTQKFSAFLQGT